MRKKKQYILTFIWQMEFKKYDDGTMNGLVSFILSFLEDSNTKQDLIKWLMTVWENMGYASSKLFQIVKNKGVEALQGLQRRLQAALTDVCKGALHANEIFSLVTKNSSYSSYILGNSITTDINLPKNTLEEMDCLYHETIESEMLMHRLSNARKYGNRIMLTTQYLIMSYSENNGTAKGSDRGITVSSNKCNHSEDPVYCSIPKIDAQNNSVLRISTTDLEYDEQKIHLSATDQCTGHLESFAMSRLRDDFEDTYFIIERYINNVVVAWSPKLDAFRFEIRLQMTSETFASIIKEKGINIFSKNQKASEHRIGRYRLVVVSSADFEEAMRQSDIDTVALAYVNEFPDDIRMFISIPVYRNGYIHSKAQ